MTDNRKRHSEGETPKQPHRRRADSGRTAHGGGTGRRPAPQPRRRPSVSDRTRTGHSPAQDAAAGRTVPRSEQARSAHGSRPHTAHPSEQQPARRTAPQGSRPNRRIPENERASRAARRAQGEQERRAAGKAPAANVPGAGAAAGRHTRPAADAHGAAARHEAGAGRHDAPQPASSAPHRRPAGQGAAPQRRRQAAGSARTPGAAPRARRAAESSNPVLRAIRRFQPYDSATGNGETPAEQAAERARSPYYDWLVKAFAVVLGIGLVLGLLLFLRPTVSASENRTLTQFPQFTWDSFLNGEWTKGISTWYSDTYPFRDQLISLDQAFNSLYGINTDTQMYGGVTHTDAIPDSGSSSSDASSDSAKTPAKLPKDYNASDLENAVEGQVTEGLYVKDGAAYAGYGFTKDAATTYADAINTAHDALDGTTQVYSILVPNNSAVLLSDDELKAMGGSDQGQAINYYYSLYKDDVKTIDTLDTLKQHKDEYLYFRTDHHWTSLAAYYVYQKFCEAKGMDSHDIGTFKEVDFSGFLGSYYSKLNTPAMKANPDTVQAWIPNDTNKMTYTDSSGNTVKWNVIRKDVKDWAANSKYSCFIGGDQPWAEIHNPKIDDGSSCLVLKESYGNSFVPWLVDHYQTVYIADFRYTTQNVADFCKEHNVNDLIVINNIQIIGSTEVAGKIQSLLTPTSSETDSSSSDDSDGSESAASDGS
ncbi:MAG: DHHW family protein [Eggerthellaceae bacterium]|jgi:hypothetical protein